MSRSGRFAVTALVVLGLVFVGNVTVRVWGALMEDDEADSARLVSCETGAAGRIAATIRVTNRESFESDFAIQVVFEHEGDGARIGADYASVAGLDPGGITETVARSPTEAPTTGYTCEITMVDQFTSS